MSKRVFVGIGIPQEIIEECMNIQAKLSDLAILFIPPADIHLTLLPPWEMINQPLIEEKIRIALRHTKRFRLHLEHLALGPNAMKPRFIWIVCSASEELVKLKKALLTAFNISDHIPFIPHLTLARLSQEDGKRLKHQPIKKSLKLSMPVASVELFESPHQGGAGYKILASIPIPFHGSTFSHE